MRRNLWRLGVRGYRLHWKAVPGRPDIAFPKRRVAVFVNGCFWHRCPNCNLPLPKTHRRFWLSKFKRNRRRDEEKLRELALAGWESVVIWECQLRDQPSRCVRRIIHALHATSNVHFQGPSSGPEIDMAGQAVASEVSQREQPGKRKMSRISYLATELEELQLRVSLLEERCEELSSAHTGLEQTE